MRTATFLVALFAVFSSTFAQDICTPVATCTAALSAITIPVPYYALNFSTDPRSAGAVYGWATTGANETSCASSAFHQGVVQLVGSTDNSKVLGPSINLTASVGEPNAIATPLPSAVLFGTGTSLGSVSAGTAGWSVEVTVKALAQTGWAKVFDFGQVSAADGGGGYYDVLMGWNSGNDYFAWTADAALNGGSDIENVINPVVYGQWYHVVLVWQEMPSGEATWLSFVNGQLTQQLQNGYFPPAVARESANLGRSNWGDSYFVGEIDTFNIYNYALTADQANALAANAQGGCAVAYGVPAAPVNSGVVPTPLFDASFTTDPRNGATVNYGWEQSDADDTTCGLDAQHQGLLVLNGMYVPNTVPGGYVNLSTSTGPDSIGQVLPTIGGTSAGTGAAAGWSFESTFKIEVVYPYAKLFDIAAPQVNGVCRYDVLFGYNGGSVSSATQGNPPTLQFDVCDGNGNQYSISGAGPLQLGTWYNIIISVQQLAYNSSWASYTMYINGVRAGSSVGYYPEAVVRVNGDMGKSSWSDSYWGGLVDSFRVYNYALNPAQAQNLSTVALGSAATAHCPMATSLPSVVPSDAIIYSLDFNADPSAAAGGAPLYQWAPFDPTDSAADQVTHAGVIILNGFANHTYAAGSGYGPYVNLSAASGPASVGQVLPLIGTDTTGLWSQGSVGFSIEISVKLREQLTWAKVYDLGAARSSPGNGNCNGDLVFGWYSNNDQLEFETCTDFSAGLSNRLIMTQTTALDTWYHVMVVVQQSYSNEATAFGYVNGQPVGNLSIAYPYAEYRRDATLGASDWFDDMYINATYDLFRVYNQALNPMQVLRQYGAAFNVAVNLPAPSSSSSSSGAGTATVAASSSSAAGTAAVSAASSSTSTSAASASSSSSAAAAVVSSSSSTAAVSVASSSSSTIAASTVSSSSSSTAAPVVSTTSSSTAANVAASSSTATVTPSTAATSTVVVASSGPAASSAASSSAAVAPTSTTPITTVSSSSTAGAPTTINAAASTFASVGVLAVCALASLALML